MRLEDRTVPTPMVTIAALADATEGGANGVFRLTRTETAGTLNVGYSPSGTAEPYTDYTYSMLAQFADGQATVDVTITPTNDTTSEPTETVTLTLNSGIGYTVGTPAAATLNLFDNDTVVTVEKIADGVEGVSNGLFRFTRVGYTAGEMTVHYWVDGTPMPGVDYVALSGSITLAANSATADLTVTVLDDSTAEYDESLTLTLDPGTGYEVGTPYSATVTIADTETPVVRVQNGTDAMEGSRRITTQQETKMMTSADSQSLLH